MIRIIHLFTLGSKLMIQLIKQLSTKSVQLLSFSIIIFLLGLNIKYTTFTYSIFYPIASNDSILSNLILLSVFIGVFYVAWKIINRLSDKKVILSIVMIHLIAFIIRLAIVLSFDNAPVADSWNVLNGANTFLFTNDIQSLYIGNYFALYPFQLSLVLIYMPFAYFFQYAVKYYYITQVVLTQLTLIGMSIIAYKLSHNKASLWMTLVVNLFVPHYFISFFIYGNLYSLFGLVYAFLFSLYFKGNSNKLHRVFLGIIIGLFLGLAYLSRLSTSIIFIAILITAVFYSRNFLRFFLILISITFIWFVPMKIIINHFNVADTQLGLYAHPSSSWLRIGIGYSGFDGTTPGMHNRYIDDDFTNFGYDVERLNQKNIEEVKATLAQLITEKELDDFFFEKAKLQWTDPDFAITTLIFPFKGTLIENPRLESESMTYGSGGMSVSPTNALGTWIIQEYPNIRIFEKGYYLSIFSLLAYQILKKKKSDWYDFLFQLIIIGYFLAQLLLEIQGHYMYAPFSLFLLYTSIKFSNQD